MKRTLAWIAGRRKKRARQERFVRPHMNKIGARGLKFCAAKLAFERGASAAMSTVHVLMFHVPSQQKDFIANRTSRNLKREQYEGKKEGCS